MHSVVSRRFAQAATTKIAKELPLKLVPYVVPPAVYSFGRGPTRATPQPQPQQEQPVPRSSKKRRSRLRSLKAVCASAAHALPVAGVRSLLVHGAQQLSSVVSFSGLTIGGLAFGVAAKGIRRWHAARRSARRAMVAVNMGPAAEVSIVTYNIRGIMDRWPERAPVLRKCLKQADADVFCFQEVLTGEFAQEVQLLGSDYQVHECRAALSHLSATSMLGAAYAATVRALLRFSWARSWLVSLPESIESWRERNQLTGNWSRLLRDLAIAPFYGNSIASRLPAVQPEQVQQAAAAASSSSSSSWTGNCSSITSCRGSSSSAAADDLLILGDFRAAQRVCLQLHLSAPPTAAADQQQQPDRHTKNSDRSRKGEGAAVTAASGGSSSSSSSDVVHVWLINTHLDHAAPSIRSRQMEAICAWMEPLKQPASCAGIIVTGDLNAPPSEEVHTIMAQHGYFSTHKAAHGTEPSHTWPSGIQAPLMDQGEPHCADYIYAWQAGGYQLHVTAAQLCGHLPTHEDETLYPSDHIGIQVKLRVVAQGSSSSSSRSSSSADAEQQQQQK